LSEDKEENDKHRQTDRRLAAGSRSLSLANNLDKARDKDKDDKRKDSNQDEGNSSNQK
jgi:hypothetical protein